MNKYEAKPEIELSYDQHKLLADLATRVRVPKEPSQEAKSKMHVNVEAGNDVKVLTEILVRAGGISEQDRLVVGSYLGQLSDILSSSVTIEEKVRYQTEFQRSTYDQLFEAQRQWTEDMSMRSAELGYKLTRCRELGAFAIELSQQYIEVSPPIETLPEIAI